MNEIERRIRANRLLDLPVNWQDELVYPYYDGLSILNVAQAVAQFFGVEVGCGLDSSVWGGDMPQPQRVVLFLSDGLSYNRLKQFMAQDSELAQTVQTLNGGRDVLPLTSIAPSTTVVALPTLWTGKPSVTHGIVGTCMYLREVAAMSNILFFKPILGDYPGGELNRWGVDADTFVTEPSIPQRLNEMGVPTYLLLDYSLMGTGLSRILHRGIEHDHTYLHGGLNDVWDRLRDVLRDTRGQRCYVSAYLPNVDKLAHLYGADNVYARQEIRYQMQQLQTILTSDEVQDGQTLVMLIADHGHHDAPVAVDLSADPVIESATFMTYGAEARLARLHLRDIQSVVERINTQYSEQLACVPMTQAIDAGLFGVGEHHPELQYRSGDLLLIPRLNVRLVDKLHPAKLVSIHGGLSDWEMLVPFIWRCI
ncbi:MAG: alkaline phosphatase family protein [Phototrophicales bacterium]